eukprot:CAMPEP_0119104204 /NCGR_PEP_ID=MMETSP1180-20130426/2472_1 /TAXON_ID=3052 ORGANISM="Chlamydomonas cf sp, Strain CCMP681" /NCGR_SAMPLE_ID=MMETSP1180 /ASSEMBLY_ACC=CAM_ASM_000741 /LENGTH=83 /DNA_ID=CAMNT_0007088891 /DNA_START=198 /DNA_END=451 /DNA_ORIENTATION=-
MQHSAEASWAWAARSPQKGQEIRAVSGTSCGSSEQALQSVPPAWRAARELQPGGSCMAALLLHGEAPACQNSCTVWGMTPLAM